MTSEPYPKSRRRGWLFLLIGVVLLLADNAASANNFQDHWFKVRGRWDGHELREQSLALRDADADPSKAQVSGQVTGLDPTLRSFHIGPFEVEWSARTRFEAPEAAVLVPGATVRVVGKLVDPLRIDATALRLESDIYGPDVIQVTGLATSSQERPDGFRQLEILGIPVRTTLNGYNNYKSLTRRQDARRPDDQLRFDVAGRPVTIGGEYNVTPWFRDDLDFKPKKEDGTTRLSQELSLELFYPITDFTALFLRVKGVGQSDFDLKPGSDDDHQYEFARDETWIYFERVFNSAFSLQIGRQNVAEVRGWWWDKDLDSVRVYHDDGPFHFELTAGEQLGAESTLRSIDQVEEGVARLLGMGSWMWASKQKLEVYALSQWDHSGHDKMNDLVLANRQDSADDDLVWFGGRVIGDRNLDNYGAVLYWTDLAFVRGRERLSGFDEVTQRFSRVSETSRQNVSGWGFDSGVSWTMPLPLEPTLTVSYARGSGDKNPNDGTDHNFRQTGLHRNKWRFRGVNRFRTYGELLRPELSNIGIGTVALGFPLLRNSSVELVYHKYDQVEASTLVRDGRIRAKPNGVNRDLGWALDLVTNFREYKQFEFGFTGSMFNPGSAYGKTLTSPAYGLLLDLVYTF